MTTTYRPIREMWAVSTRAPLTQSNSLMDGVVMLVSCLPTLYDVEGLPNDRQDDYINVVLVPCGLRADDVQKLFECEGAYAFRQITTFLEVHNYG